MTAVRRANREPGKKPAGCHPERSISVRLRTEMGSRRTPRAAAQFLSFLARYKVQQDQDRSCHRDPSTARKVRDANFPLRSGWQRAGCCSDV